MKICYLADASSLHTFKWTKYFFQKGYQIDILTLKPPAFDYRGMRIFQMKKIILPVSSLSHLINFLPIIFQIRRFKRREKPDVFHALGSSNGWLAVFARCYPLIYTIADPGILSIPFQRKLPRIYQILNKYAIKRADLLVCDGENIKEAMMKLGADPKKIKLIRYGVDTDKFKPNKPKVDLKKKLFGLDNKIIISTKPLRKECDVETLVRAAPLVLKEIPEAKFLIIGDGEEKERLIRLSKSLEITDKIKFIGWVLPEDLPDYFNLADVFVCTSLVETGLASSTAEAMACGVPLVVSDSGDNKIFIKDGENGFIFPLKNSKVLAKKIITLLKDKNLQKKFWLAHHSWIEENNNYQKEMAKMEKIYQSFKK
ncbi:MAG: glycosyltransferase family 4 protein [Minisyncoccales bacterium]